MDPREDDTCHRGDTLLRGNRPQSLEAAFIGAVQNQDVSTVLQWPTVPLPLSFRFVHPPKTGPGPTVPSTKRSETESWNDRRKARLKKRHGSSLSRRPPRKYLLADDSNGLLTGLMSLAPIVLRAYPGTGQLKPGAFGSGSLPVAYCQSIQENIQRSWFRERSRFVATLLVLMGYLYTTNPLPPVSQAHCSIAATLLRFLRDVTTGSTTPGGRKFTTGERCRTQRWSTGTPSILDAMESSFRHDQDRLYNPQRSSGRETFLALCPFAKQLLVFLYPCFANFQEYKRQQNQSHQPKNSNSEENEYSETMSDVSLRQRLDKELHAIFVVTGFFPD
jgi:hypothetical protein